MSPEARRAIERRLATVPGFRLELKRRVSAERKRRAIRERRINRWVGFQ